VALHMQKETSPSALCIIPRKRREW
jgi:hypothetical protein